MSNEKIKPVLTPYHYRYFDYEKGGARVNKTKYVARCGCCGNEIDRYTSRYTCMYCRVPIDWTGAPYSNKYILTERAIQTTYGNI